MNEEMRLLLKLTEENTRFLMALKYLKGISDECVDGGWFLGRSDFEAAMRIAGLEDKEVNVITFDNAPDEVAYEAD